MKRYEFDADGYREESHDGDYVLFTDHQAELKALAAEVLPWIDAMAEGFSVPDSEQEKEAIALRAKLLAIAESSP